MKILIFISLIKKNPINVITVLMFNVSYGTTKYSCLKNTIALLNAHV